MSITVSRTDLARNTREIVEQVRKGETIVVQSYGEEQIILLDTFDYKLLRALAHCAVTPGAADDPVTLDDLDGVIRAYLDRRISLGKAARQLGLSRFELLERFERLGIPLRIGPETLDEAREEVRVARLGKKAAR
jgi:hypothetical protein